VEQETTDGRAIEVVNNLGAGRFEVRVGGALAFAEYHLRGRTITFTHTDVPPALEGRGIGNALARTALEHARAEGLRVVPLCPFIAAFIRRHREYQPLVSSGG
jgi:predicted GNAT family acetyltransferase